MLVFVSLILLLCRTTAVLDGGCAALSYSCIDIMLSCSHAVGIMAVGIAAVAASAVAAAVVAARVCPQTLQTGARATCEPFVASRPFHRTTAHAGGSVARRKKPEKHPHDRRWAACLHVRGGVTRSPPAPKHRSCMDRVQAMAMSRATLTQGGPGGPGARVGQRLSSFFLPAMDSISTRIVRMLLPFWLPQAFEVGGQSAFCGRRCTGLSSATEATTTLGC